jgi:hypothetical protein
MNLMNLHEPFYPCSHARGREVLRIYTVQRRAKRFVKVHKVHKVAP